MLLVSFGTKYAGFFIINQALSVGEEENSTGLCQCYRVVFWILVCC